MKRHKMKRFLLLLRSRGIELLACVVHNGDSLTTISGTHAYTVLLQDWVWPEISREKKLMIPGGPTFGVTKRLQKWPRYFAHKDLQRGAETDASSIEVRDTAYRTQAATKRTVRFNVS